MNKDEVLTPVFLDAFAGSLVLLGFSYIVFLCMQAVISLSGSPMKKRLALLYLVYIAGTPIFLILTLIAFTGFGVELARFLPSRRSGGAKDKSPLPLSFVLVMAGLWMVALGVAYWYSTMSLKQLEKSAPAFALFTVFSQMHDSISALQNLRYS